MNDAQGILAQVPATTKNVKPGKLHRSREERCQSKHARLFLTFSLIQSRTFPERSRARPEPEPEPDAIRFSCTQAAGIVVEKILYGSSHDVSFDDPLMGGKPWYLRGCGCPSGIYLGFFFVHGLVDAGFGYLRRWVQRRGKRRGFSRFTEFPSEQEAWKLIESYRSCLVEGIVYIKQPRSILQHAYIYI